MENNNKVQAKKVGRPKVYANGSKMITVMIPTDALPEFRAYLAELRKKYTRQ
jgi:hypothetical protein